MTRDLTPQTPGETPDSTEPTKLEKLLEGNAAEILASLDDLSDPDLDLLGELEATNRKRKGVTAGIAAEAKRRAEEASGLVPPPEPKGVPIGNAADYANMHARDVDATKLERPVLTRDGWLLPAAKVVGS